jgi:hypothetical protein
VWLGIQGVVGADRQLLDNVRLLAGYRRTTVIDRDHADDHRPRRPATRPPTGPAWQRPCKANLNLGQPVSHRPEGNVQASV